MEDQLRDGISRAPHGTSKFGEIQDPEVRIVRSFSQTFKPWAFHMKVHEDGSFTESPFQLPSNAWVSRIEYLTLCHHSWIVHVYWASRLSNADVIEITKNLNCENISLDGWRCLTGVEQAEIDPSDYGTIKKPINREPPMHDLVESYSGLLTSIQCGSGF